MRLWQTKDKRSRRFGGHIAALGAAVLLAACTSILDPVELPTDPVQLPGASPEANAQHAAIVATYGGVFRDAEVERTLAQIASRLVAASDDPGRTYAITILNAATVNAFALPEGYLYVTRGLLTLASDAAEVAAVFAHEMAHVTADHAGQRREQALTAAIVNDAVEGVVGDAAPGDTALVTAQQTLASFSRQQELEADAIGIATVSRAGYDPYAAARFLLAMSRYEDYRLSLGVRQDQRPAFLASHPSNQNRIDSAVATAASFGPPGGGITDRDRYLAAIDGVIYGDDVDQGFIRGRSFVHSELAIGFTVTDGFVLDNTQEAVLATGPDGTALRFDAVAVAPDQPLTEYLLSGWVNGLEPASVRDTSINGLTAASATAAAGGWAFRITVVRVGTATYRFIFANDRDSGAFTSAAEAIAGSFRQLSPQEVAALRPLRIDVVTVGAGDSAALLAGRMGGVESPAVLFAVLNGLEPGTDPAPGSRAKLVVE